MTGILFGSLVVLLLLGAPIAIALGLSAVVVYFFMDAPLLLIPQRMFGGLDAFPLVAAPFFVLAGNIMAGGGISRRIVNLALVIAGRIPGALSVASIVSGMFFAAISGSGAASTAALGSIMIPEMVERKYDKDFSSVVQAMAGSLGIVIPPSVPLILYGIGCGTSVGALFIAGILPGIVSGLGLIIVAIIISKKKGYIDKLEKMALKQKLRIILEAIPAILMPVIILGGIYSGYFTPTEASCVAVVYGFIVSIVIYREITVKKLRDILTSSVITSAIVLFIIGTAANFASILIREGIPTTMANFIMGITDNPYLFLLVINVFLLIIGTFMETAAAIIILTPILAPIAVQLGVDPVHFGVIMIMNLAIGLCTPPVGINLYVASNIAKTKIDNMMKWLWPFLGVSIAALLLVTYIPQISLFLVKFLN
ncbi:MAG: TRAP transporter large permease [Clostridiaceae bacterium]|nr:TRAP transporter large permease [Clostridiaceae bacterium]